MHMFRSIVFCAALVGLIAGLIIGVVQHFSTTELILRAEVYEKAAEAAEARAPAPVAPAAVAAVPVATHDHGAAGHDHPAAMADHQHDAAAWERREGFERTAFTVLSNVVTAIGYALALVGLLALRGKPVDWRAGLLWGLGGFAAVTLAPGLGLSPSLPGVPDAPLVDRQVWWVATALCTGLGLALVAFGRNAFAVALALCLIAAPHVIGAPRLDSVDTLVPAALSHQFTVAVTLTSLMFWALLGTLSGLFYRRFAAA